MNPVDAINSQVNAQINGISKSAADTNRPSAPLPFLQPSDIVDPAKTMEKLASLRTGFANQFKPKFKHHTGLFEGEDEVFAKRDAKLAKEAKAEASREIAESKRDAKSRDTSRFLVPDEVPSAKKLLKNDTS